MNSTHTKLAFLEALRGNSGLPSKLLHPSSAEALPFSIPPNAFETFIPGYSVLSGFLSQFFGFDVTLFFSLCLVLFGFTKSLDFLKTQLWTWTEGLGTSEILIESDNDAYSWVTAWLMKRGAANGARALVVRRSNALGPEGNPIHHAVSITDGPNSAPQSVWYEPAMGSYYFWYRQRPFRLQLEMVNVMAPHGRSGRGGMKQARISCLGRSPTPIKALISEAAAQRNRDLSTKTIIKRGKVNQFANQWWQMVATRPSRPLSTIILDPGPKDQLIADIDDYLRPETARWYSSRGIPYRRGYLLHGPPGTGKTSLSFAIAGHFNLEIYCISLLETHLTENSLSSLFDSLPTSCVVLLEDIDHAGVRNLAKQPENGSGNPNAPPTLSVPSPLALPGGNISLSGLLNVIDGISSQEGRVLIMTTNHVEKLDDALIRPGRVDLQVEFTNATQPQIQALFVRMYQLTSEKSVAAPGRRPGNVAELETKGEKRAEEVQVSEKDDQIERLAQSFAQICPGDAFSPAEVQGYLLTKKHDPEGAVAGAAKWRDELLAKRNPDSK